MVVITKWHTLVAGLWLALGCGYWGTFGTFSPALQRRYDLDPGDLSTIGIGTTVVGFVTFTTGMYTDRVGVTTALLTGVFINMLGWFLYGIIAINDWRPMSPVVMFTALAIFATYGAGMLTGAVFKVITNNFSEEDRSQVVGIAKAWVGVTSGFTSMIYVTLFPSADDAPERLYFVWFIVANLAIFGLLPIPFMRIVGSDLRSNLALRPRVRIAYLLVVTLVLIVLTVALAIIRQDLSRDASLAVSCGLILLVSLPWLSLFPARAVGSPSSVTDRLSPAKDTPEVHQPSSTTWLGGGALDMAGNPEQRPEINRPLSPWASGPLQMMMRADAWLLWFCVFALMSGGVVLTTNFGAITASRSGVHVPSASAVSVFSASQALGRLTGGVVSDFFVVHHRLPRPWYFVVLSVGMATAHVVLCVPGPAALYVGTLIAGYTFGSTYPLMIVTIFELFGAERIASNYMVFDGTPTGAASLLVAKSFTQWVYQRNAEGDTCSGDSCFTLAYGGVIVLQLVSAICACLLACRSATVYRSSVFAKS